VHELKSNMSDMACAYKESSLVGFENPAGVVTALNAQDVENPSLTWAKAILTDPLSLKGTSRGRGSTPGDT